MKRRALRRVSQKRLDSLWERQQVVAEAKVRSKGMCYARDRWPEVKCCPGMGWHAHELQQRSARAGAELDIENVVMLCACHHGAVHDHLALAHERGLIRWSYE